MDARLRSQARLCRLCRGIARQIVVLFGGRSRGLYNFYPWVVCRSGPMGHPCFCVVVVFLAPLRFRFPGVYAVLSRLVQSGLTALLFDVVTMETHPAPWQRISMKHPYSFSFYSHTLRVSSHFARTMTEKQHFFKTLAYSML